MKAKSGWSMFLLASALLCLAGLYQARAAKGSTLLQRSFSHRVSASSTAAAASWSYRLARTPESALNALNGGSSGQIFRSPELCATVKDGHPFFHIFYQPDYNTPASWKWNLKGFTKLNELMDFLSYRNAFASQPKHGQMKVVMVTIDGKNMFYVFYNNNTDDGVFAKDEWAAFKTTTPGNVLDGVNQSSVAGDAIPASDMQVSATDSGFYYFFNTHRYKGSAKWGWARCETVEGALNFLSGKPPYTNKAINYASIAAVQDPNQIVFYVFYHAG